MTTKIKTFGGNIGIGTTDPGDFKLNVHGSLKTSSLVVNGVTNAQVPIGLIAPWYGSLGSIPSGWALCDGTPGLNKSDGSGTIDTPDLRTKFIRGANGDAPSPVATGTTGGQNTASLSAANLAPHSHGVTVDAGNVNHSHTSTQTNKQHTHGENSNSSDAPHDHETTGQTPVTHNHGENSNATSNPHSHGSGNNSGFHNHGTSQSTGAHSHGVRSIEQIGLSRPGPLAIITESTVAVTGYSNASHWHKVTNNTQALHSHGSTGQSSAPHRHPIALANTPHHHNVSAANAPHSHNISQINAPHSHTVNAVDAPHAHTASSNNTGQATSFSVLNAYYALFYIMKI